MEPVPRPPPESPPESPSELPSELPSEPPRAGLYGKLPARGDFVTFGLPRSFVEPWDGWLQTAVAASRDRLGADWLACYLTAPVWRFALAPGACGPMAAAGVLIPSVDAVNRHFPLAVCALLPGYEAPVDIATADANWFRQCEECALACLDPAPDMAELEQRIAAVTWTASPASPPLAAEVTAKDAADEGSWFDVTPDLVEGALSPAACLGVLKSLLSRRYGRHGLWWTTGSDRVAPSVVVTPDLPAPALFAAFLGGSALEPTGTGCGGQGDVAEAAVQADHAAGSRAGSGGAPT